MAIAAAVALAATYILYTYMVNRSSRLVRLLERGGELSSKFDRVGEAADGNSIGSFSHFCRSENLD